MRLHPSKHQAHLLPRATVRILLPLSVHLVLCMDAKWICSAVLCIIATLVKSVGKRHSTAAGKFGTGKYRGRRSGTIFLGCSHRVERIVNLSKVTSTNVSPRKFLSSCDSSIQSHTSPLTFFVAQSSRFIETGNSVSGAGKIQNKTASAERLAT